MNTTNLLIICHAYTNFQKDPIEIIAPYVSSVNVFVRTNRFAEIGKFLPISNLKHFSSKYKIDRRVIPKNIQVYSTPLWYIPTDCAYKKLGDSHYSHIRSVIKKNKIRFDLIHAHFTWSAGYAGARLKEEYGVPLVVTAHGYDIYSLPFKDVVWQEKIERVLNTADHIITVSQSNLKCIQKLDVSTPVTVIPNGFRSDLFYPRDMFECRRMLNLPQNKKIILTVGNLEPVKCQSYLIEAIRMIVQKRKDVLCVIVGSGTLKNTLACQIHHLGLEEYVLLVGGKSHDEISIWMNSCDIFVLPSINEGNPTVMFEALGCGKPFVGTKVGGVPEVISSDKYGLLVDPANIDDLAEKILTALDKEWDQKAILAYAEQFTWDNIAVDILKVYGRVLGR